MSLHVDGRHEATRHFAPLFTYAHLPEAYREISRQCCGIAQYMVDHLPDGPELSFGLRQLLLAKDAFVRAAVLGAAKSFGDPA